MDSFEFNQVKTFEMESKNENNAKLLPIQDKNKVKDLSEINDIIDYNFTFLSNLTDTLGFQYSFNQTNDNQVLYLILDANYTIKNNINITSRNDQGNNLTGSSINFYNDFGSDTQTYVKLNFPRANRWDININYTGTFSPQIDSVIINIRIIFPKSGFDFNTPNKILDNATRVIHSVAFPFESIIWEIRLEYNQRIDISISEGDNNLVLNGADAKIYEYDTFSSSIRLKEEQTKGSSGLFEFYWVVESQNVESNVLWIKIDIAGNLGLIELTLDIQNEGYSINTAIPLELNKFNSIFQKQNLYDQHQYFKFVVPDADVDIYIFASSNNPLILSDSVFNIFYERDLSSMKDIFERESKPQGTINDTFYSDKSGTFYIKYFPDNDAKEGSFYIVISYEKLPQFIWKLEFILLDFIMILLLPGILIYYYIKNSPQNIQEWELKIARSEVFKHLSRNNKLDPKMEVPDQKILLIRKNLLIKELIIDTVPIDNDSSSIVFRYKNLVSNTVSLIIIAMLILFWIFNLFFFSFFAETSLPYRVTDLASINEIVFFGFVLIVILTSIIFFLKEITIQQILNELENTIDEFNQTKYMNNNHISLMDIETVQKNLAYVRVLWSQADKGFKSNNYSLFIIRADNAVKKLLEIRFQQLISKIEDKIDFSVLIDSIRQHGFDIPSNKKIEIYRKIRNKVVHSSHLLDEKTAIETYAYYSKFLTRLGLRT